MMLSSIHLFRSSDGFVEHLILFTQPWSYSLFLVIIKWYIYINVMYSIFHYCLRHFFWLLAAKTIPSDITFQVHGDDLIK